MSGLFHLQSPYILLSIDQYDHPLEVVLSELQYPHDYKTNEFWSTQIGKAFFNYRRYVIDDFYHLLTGSPPHEWENEEGAEEVATQVRYEAEFWLVIWRLIEEIDKRSIIKVDHPAKTFYWIVEEFELVMFFAFKRNSDSKSAVLLTRLIQTQNRQLEALGIDGNPFDEESKPVTFALVQKAFDFANANDEFRKQFFNPMVRARMKLLSNIREGHPKSHNIDGGTERRGRKPKK